LGAVQASWFGGKSKAVDQKEATGSFKHVGAPRALGLSSFSIELKVLCLHTHTNICTHACSIQQYIHTNIHTRTYLLTYLSTYVRTYIHTVNIHTYIHAYIHV
jgi:hypothetical protein